MESSSMIAVRGALLLVLSTLATLAMADTLCLPGEQIVFSCSVKMRIVSLCASTPFTKNTGDMQYRFGTRSNIEFQFPRTPSAQGKNFHLSSTSYGGGGETHLSFTNSSYEYIIYERMTKGEEDREGVRPTIFSAGVFVRKGSKQVAKYRCNSNENAGINALAYDVLPMESFKPLDLKQ
jgi:hypothetical protein